MSSSTGRSTETDICLQMIECGELLLQYDLKKFLPRSRSVNMYVCLRMNFSLAAVFLGLDVCP